MNNKGLCFIAETVSGGSITFEKTRLQMRRIIEQFLPKILHNHDRSSQWQMKRLSQLLKDPQNFQVNHGDVCSTSESFRSGSICVLGRLDELSLLTLSKMHQNLREVTGYIPTMQSKRIGWSKENLRKQIKRTSLEMLSNYEEGDEPPEPLAKALSVAALMLKPELDHPSHLVFRKRSQDIEALQNDIANAIKVLNDKKKVSFEELRNLPLVLDSNAKATKESVPLCSSQGVGKLAQTPQSSEREKENVRLRVQVKKLLTEYLLECSELQSIPESLLETLAVINKTSSRRLIRKRNKASSHASKKTYSKKEVKEEVECVLNISSQIKQIVWDVLNDSDVSVDFANAYMENVEESNYESGNEDEHLSDFPHNCRSGPNVSCSQLESVSEINHSDSNRDDGLSSLVSPKHKLSVKLESMHINGVDSVHSDWFDNSSSFSESKTFKGANSTSNDYHLRSFGQQEERDLCRSVSTNQDRLNSHISPKKPLGRNNAEQKGATGDLGCRTPKFISAECSQEEKTLLHRKENSSRNQYLLIQEASDETSMIAYSLVGCMLNKFAQLDRLDLSDEDVSYLQGNTSDLNIEVPEDRVSSCDETTSSIILHFVEERIPSFSNSGKEHLKELLGMV